MWRCIRRAVLSLWLALAIPPARAGTFSITETQDSVHAARRDVTHGNRARDVNSVGILQGASLIGFDHEHLFTDRIGLQLGAGFVGMDAGFTLHLAPGIRTNHLCAGYWNFGIAGDKLLAGVAGLTYVHRTQGLFTTQLGLGFVVVEGALRVPDGGNAAGLSRGAPMLLFSAGVCPR